MNWRWGEYGDGQHHGALPHPMGAEPVLQALPAGVGGFGAVAGPVIGVEAVGGFRKHLIRLGLSAAFRACCIRSTDSRGMPSSWSA